MHPAELGHDERHELSHQAGEECLVTAETGRVLRRELCIGEDAASGCSKVTPEVEHVHLKFRCARAWKIPRWMEATGTSGVVNKVGVRAGSSTVWLAD